MFIAKNKDMIPGPPPPLHHQMTGFVLHQMDGFEMSMSYYLPGGHVETVAAKMELIFFILEGEMTITMEDGLVVTLNKYDSISFKPGDIKTVENKTNLPVLMLVVAGPFIE